MAIRTAPFPLDFSHIYARFRIAEESKPSKAELEVHSDVQDTIISAAVGIEEQIADGREKSLALTHLEEALMWAGKAIFKKE